MAQLKPGNLITEKVEVYISQWKKRCYDDLPDEILEKLAKTNRAPSYKQIAIAILRNDHQLKSLGFEGKESQWYRILKNKDNKQQELF